MNNKNKIYRTLIWCACFLFILFVCIGLFWSPQKLVYTTYEENTQAVLVSLSSEDISSTNSCDVDAQGMVKVTGFDAFVIYEGVDVTARSCLMKFAQPISQDFEIQFFLDDGEGFSEENSFWVKCLKGDKTAGVNFGEQNIKNLRVDLDADYQLEEVSLYSEELSIIENRQNLSRKNIVKGIVLAIVICGILILLDGKLGFIQKIYVTSKNIAKGLKVSHLVVYGMALLPGFLISYFVNDRNFSVELFVFVSAVEETIICLWFNRNSIIEKAENVFLKLLLLVGVTITVCQPFSHISWDIETHYRLALGMSSFEDVYATEADLNVTNVTSVFPAEQTTADTNKERIKQMNHMYQEYVYGIDHQFSLAHLPAALGIAVLRCWGGSFYLVYTFGKLLNLVIYALLCFFGMRRLHSGKMIFAVVALLPTSIFIACNYSYDYWVTGFSLLGISYFVANCQEKDKTISYKDTVIMCASLVLSCIPKPVYIGLLLIPFFMKPKKVQNRKIYYGICVSAIVILGIILVLASLQQVTVGGDSRGGDVNPIEQIKYILGFPLSYSKTLLYFMKDYLSWESMASYINNFAYAGIVPGAVVIQILLVVVTMSDKSEYDDGAYAWYVKGISVLIFLGEAAVVATSLYIAFTPVGYEAILGCQGRYIIPLLYPLLALLFSKGVMIPVNRGVYNMLVLSVAIGMIYYDIYQAFLPLVV